MLILISKMQNGRLQYYNNSIYQNGLTMIDSNDCNTVNTYDFIYVGF